MLSVRGCTFLTAVFVENKGRKNAPFLAGRSSTTTFASSPKRSARAMESNLKPEKLKRCSARKNSYWQVTFLFLCFRFTVDCYLQFKKYFPLACNLPPLLLLNAEFEDLLSKICDNAAEKNKGSAYGFFEISGGDVASAQQRMATAKYIGSTCARVFAKERLHRRQIANPTLNVGF